MWIEESSIKVDKSNFQTLGLQSSLSLSLSLSRTSDSQNHLVFSLAKTMSLIFSYCYTIPVTNLESVLNEKHDKLLVKTEENRPKQNQWIWHDLLWI